MATIGLSPRKALSPEEREARDAKYRVTIKDFGQVLKNLVTIFQSLVALNTALSSAGKGAHLAFPAKDKAGNDIPGQVLIFNKKNLKKANSMFAKRIYDLRNYLRVSKKKAKAPVTPESFKGTYMPVYAGAALRTFFTQGAGNFGFLSPAANQGPALMDSLPNLKNGLALRNTLTMLFFIYVHAQGLQSDRDSRFNRSDAVMDTAFGGTIPAEWFSVKGADGKTAKRYMSQYPADQQLNTYDVIRQSYPFFLTGQPIPNPAKDAKTGLQQPDFPGTNSQGQFVFPSYFFQNIAAVNYYSGDSLRASGDAQLAGIADVLARPDTRQVMLTEHQTVKAVSQEWSDILEPGRKVTRANRKKAQDARKKALAGGQ